MICFECQELCTQDLFVPLELMFYRRIITIFSSTLMACGLFWVYFYLSGVFIYQPSQRDFRRPVKNSYHASIIRDLYNPYIHPITSNIFISHTEKVFWLSDPLRFTEPLGKKILILDADSRHLDYPKGVLTKAPLNVTGLPTDTSGRLNHFMYAMIHGYDYRLVHIPRGIGRSGTWTKVTAIKEALKHYEYVVFLDADAMLPHPHLPMEWLFNYWDITPETLVAMALDPEAPHNRDWNGRTLLNTGFIIAQRSPRTHELFEAWESCPTETRYPGCLKWSREWAHEQSAFGNHVRYEFNGSDDIRVLSCAEANGCPEVAGTGCVGELVRHYWGDKRSMPTAVGNVILQYFLPQLHGLFYQGSGTLVVNMTERAFA